VTTIAGGSPVELPRASRNRELSGDRFCGYFCAPETGSYRFFVTSDDGARVDLLLDDGMNTVIQIDNAAGQNEWNRFAGQRSPFIQLNAGEAYRLEAFHKNRYRRNNFQLGVELPSGARLTPVQASLFSQDCSAGYDTLSGVSQFQIAEEACRCTDDGFSGGVDTNRRGCFNQDLGAYFAGIAGRNTGSAVGEYLESNYGTASGTSQLLGDLWSRAFEGWVGSNYRSARARVCYVRSPELCPLAQPSSAFPGASWRICD